MTSPRNVLAERIRLWFEPMHPNHGPGVFEFIADEQLNALNEAGWVIVAKPTGDRVEAGARGMLDHYKGKYPSSSVLEWQDVVEEVAAALAAADAADGKLAETPCPPSGMSVLACQGTDICDCFGARISQGAFDAFPHSYALGTKAADAADGRVTVDPDDEDIVERIAPAVHQVYLDTCARLGWQVKPENQIPYASLSEGSKELDRASVRAVLTALKQDRVTIEEFTDEITVSVDPVDPETVERVARELMDGPYTWLQPHQAQRIALNVLAALRDGGRSDG